MHVTRAMHGEKDQEKSGQHTSSSSLMLENLQLAIILGVLRPGSRSLSSKIVFSLELGGTNPFLEMASSHRKST